MRSTLTIIPAGTDVTEVGIIPIFVRDNDQFMICEFTISYSYSTSQACATWTHFQGLLTMLKFSQFLHYHTTYDNYSWLIHWPRWVHINHVCVVWYWPHFLWSTYFMFSLFDPFLHCHTTMFGAHIWVSVWLLFDAKWAIMSKTISILLRWWRYPLCTRPIRFIGFYNARWLKQQCTLTHYSDYKPTSICSCSLMLRS